MNTLNPLMDRKNERVSLQCFFSWLPPDGDSLILHPVAPELTCTQLSGSPWALISISPEKKEQALAFGADHFIDSNDKPNLRQAAYGFDLLLCTAHGKVNWARLLETLKKNGKFILLGFPSVEFNPTDLVVHQLSVTGSFTGNQARMREMLSFA